MNPVSVPGAAAQPSVPSDQQIAQAVAESVRRLGQLRHYNIYITVRSGVVELTGSVANPAQEEQVVRLAKGVAGVRRVIDHLRLLAPNPIKLVQNFTPPPPLEDPPPFEPRGPAPAPAAADPSATFPLPEPAPIFQAPPPSSYDLNPPRMPPYAWPTYAPYNNASRVGIPEAYPYSAWPFIGPPHPFPKVPLGWRSVKLEFEDGYWWFSRAATKYDWWHLRYW
jgi:hypothetical protein